MLFKKLFLDLILLIKIINNFKIVLKNNVKLKIFT